MTKELTRLLLLACLLGFVIGLAVEHFYREVQPQRVATKTEPPPPPPPTQPRPRPF